MMRSREPLSESTRAPSNTGPFPQERSIYRSGSVGVETSWKPFIPPIRRLNSQLQEEEVLLFGLEDVNQLEDVGMLHSEEGRRDRCHSMSQSSKARKPQFKNVIYDVYYSAATFS